MTKASKDYYEAHGFPNGAKRPPTQDQARRLRLWVRLYRRNYTHHRHHRHEYQL